MISAAPATWVLPVNPLAARPDRLRRHVRGRRRVLAGEALGDAQHLSALRRREPVALHVLAAIGVRISISM